MFFRNTPREKLEVVEQMIEMFEERINSLEQSIRKSESYGDKRVMQENLNLNRKLLEDALAVKERIKNYR